MSLPFQKNGNLEPGIHILTLDEFEEVFGYTAHRRFLITGLKKGLSHLKDCGCTKVYIDGSFVTQKEVPGDFDACWDTIGVDIPKLIANYETLIDFSQQRKNQKLVYYGEFFPANGEAAPYTLYLDFFQKDKNDNSPKGIVQINLK